MPERHGSAKRRLEVLLALALAASLNGCGASRPLGGAGQPGSGQAGQSGSGGGAGKGGLAAGCPRDSETVPATADEVLDGVPCTPWQPSDADWSSVPTAPALLGATSGSSVLYSPEDWAGRQLISASPGGRYLYAVGTWLDAGQPRHAIVRSGDLGATFCVLATPASVSEVIAAPADPLVLYAVTAAEPSSTVLGTGLLRSTDGGASWEARPGGFPSTPNPYLAAKVARDGRTIWVTAMSTWVTPTSTMYVSRDGGGSWTAVPYPPNGSPRVAMDPAAPQRLFDQSATNSSAGFTSDDWGATWRDASLPGELVGVDAFSALYALDGQTIRRSCDWGATWATTGALVPGSSADLVPTVALLDSRRPGELFQLALGAHLNLEAAWRTIDGGASFTAVPLPDAPSFLLPVGNGEQLVARTPIGLAASRAGGPFEAGPTVIDGATDLIASPADPSTLWVPDGALLYRSRDAGASFTPAAFTWPGGRLLLDALDADVAFATANNLRTEDGGGSWQSVGTFALLDVCAPPRSCLHGWSSVGLEGWRTLSLSVDHGGTWTELVALSGVPTLNPIASALDDDRHFVAGSVSGIYETRDGGHVWTAHPLSVAGPFSVVDLVFASTETVMALGTSAGIGGHIYRSVDGGTTFDEFATVPFQVGSKARLRRSTAHPTTWFILPGDGTTPIYRSDDDAATWAAEPVTAVGVVDGPGGGYLAQAPGYGLAHFR